MSGISDMIDDLGKITEFEDSADELNLKTDRLIGTMSEKLKRLHTLLWRARREAISARMKMPQTKEDEGRVACQSHAAFHRADLIRELFICAARDEHDLWKDGCPAIGARKGFLIVVSLAGKKQSFKGGMVVRITVQDAGSDFSGSICNN
ncbi:MAG: hypothetical protein Q7S70_00385 [bacterium]|nr:hypothetical protein [bacterium]